MQIGWRFGWAALVVASVMLGGCSYPLPSDTVKTNAWMKAHNITLPNHATSSGHYAPGSHVIAEDLPAPFGRLHTVRLESDPKKPLIVFCGGRSFREENAGADIAEPLSRFGDFITYDYPGFGTSGGTGTRAEFAAAEAVMAAKVQAIMRDRSGKVIFWGHSLGGGICASLAAHAPLKSSLVLATTFAEYDDFKRNLLGPLAGLITLKVPETTIAYNTPALLKNYRGAIFVITLTQDETIPYKVEQRLGERLIADGHKVSVITIDAKGHSIVHALPPFYGLMKAAFRAKGIDTGP